MKKCEMQKQVVFFAEYVGILYDSNNDVAKVRQFNLKINIIGASAWILHRSGYLNRHCVETMYKSRILPVLAALFLAAPAAATPISYTFIADGVTENVAQQGTAVFTFDTSDLTTFSITLTDNVDPTALIASELDGLQFTFSQAPTSLVLTNVSAPTVIDCTQNTEPCPAIAGTSPYGWDVARTGADALLGAGSNGDGTFSYHPYAIVNANYDAPGGNGGLSNQQHNPLLVGPVTFTFSVAGLTGVPEISSVVFLFGTVPDPQTGTCTDGNCSPPDLNVPEPQTITLLALGLLVAGVSLRRRRYAR
jgi:hypothetical protein